MQTVPALSSSCLDYAVRTSDIVRSSAPHRHETASGTAEYFQHVRDDVGNRLRTAKTHPNVNQHRYDADERAAH